MLMASAASFGKIHALTRKKGPDVKAPITDWETDLFHRAAEKSLLKLQERSFQIKDKQPYSMFTFNREYFIQAAAYASLILDYGYPEKDCDVEYHYMDVVVFKSGKPFVCVEAKVDGRQTELLLEKILSYAKGVPMDKPDRGNDPLRKAKYIVQDKPSYFWLVCSAFRKAFLVNHDVNTFTLSPVPDIPKCQHKPMKS